MLVLQRHIIWNEEGPYKNAFARARDDPSHAWDRWKLELREIWQARTKRDLANERDLSSYHIY